MTGAGAMNRLKHVLRAYVARDWDECDMLVAHYTSEEHGGKMHDLVSQTAKKRKRY
jgi:hypothetical protein